MPVLSLALGVGATSAMFTVVNGVLRRPLPFLARERLVALWETSPHNHRRWVAPEDATGAQRVAMLAHGAWQRLFGGDADAIGRTL